jgi:uncharacterized protein YndB with AHSA1/START domain
VTKIDEIKAAARPAPVKVSRVFSAPRETVFKAWSSADHIKRWFCPSGYSVPEAKVEMRVGGAFEVCMRSPEGVDHWTRGTFTEVSAPERLAIDHHVIDPCGGGPLFSAYTVVSFFDKACEGTLMEVVQTYSLAGAAQAEQMLKGAPEGWRQTLDKLEAEVERMKEVHGATRSVVHGAFHLERTYDVSAEAVYRALSDEAAKSRWFVGPPGWRQIERRMDFRVGGRERVKGGFDGGVTTTFDALYHDIIPGERIVYTYEMRLDDRKISVSLATLQIKRAGERLTKLLVDEQGAFLDGYDDAGSRERGTGDLLDKLGASLRS